MAFTITEAFVQQYKDNLIHLSQQQGSRLRDLVRNESVTGKSYYFERLAGSEAKPATGRHVPVEIVNMEHSRRRVDLFDYEWADLVDDLDKVRLLISPESEYAIAGAWAMGRAVDQVVLGGALGEARAGAEGQTAVPFPSENYITDGGGLTVHKLIAAKERLDQAEVDPNEPRYIICTARQIGQLLEDNRIASTDYNTVKALVSGEIDTFMGFKFVRYEKLPIKDGKRVVPCWSQNGIGLAIGKDINTRMSERPDLRYAVQIYLNMAIGATRIEDEKVLVVLCDEGVSGKNTK
jgi:hypothetical protein